MEKCLCGEASEWVPWAAVTQHRCVFGQPELDVPWKQLQGLFYGFIGRAWQRPSGRLCNIGHFLVEEAVFLKTEP